MEWERSGTNSPSDERWASAEGAALRRLGSRLAHDARQFEAGWLAACNEHRELRASDPAYADAIRRVLRPLFGSLRAARLEDTELHVLELATDLRALDLDLPAVGLVLDGLEAALARSLSGEESIRDARSIGAFARHLAARAYSEDDARPAMLESGPRARSALASHGLIGKSPQMQRLTHQIAALASAPGPVLIVGPSGTGKELVARAIHALGQREARPFVAVNCAALPQELIESELFGHEKGAFTGSRNDAPGLMRAAADGTLFLDEITEMPPPTQAKLLRALEQRTVRPVGGVREYPIHARLLGATNRDPLEAIQSGSLRADVYYRMCVHRIELAPLAERPGDIPHLLQHFLAQVGSECSAPLGFSPASLSLLTAYAWPGNVRELRNVVEHSCAFAPGRWVEPEHLPEHLSRSPAVSGVMPRVTNPNAPAHAEGAAHPPDDLAPLRDVERSHICRVMKHTRGNKAQAARVLGLSRHQLYVKLERLGILDW